MNNQPGKYIESIELKIEHIGARVMHVPSREEGTINNWNDDGIFVQYAGGLARTKPTLLVWGRDDPNAKIEKL